MSLPISQYKNQFQNIVNTYTAFDTPEAIAERLRQEQASQQSTLDVLAQMERTEKRRIELKDSLRRWNESINQILMIATIALFVVFIVIVLYSVLLAPFVPVFFVVMVCSIVLGGSAIYCLRIYYDSIHRWNMDFTEYDYPPPVLETTPAAIPAAGTGNGSGAFICFNSSCCDTGTVWDASSNQCIVAPAQPF
jgi:hypothetical protein